MEETMSFKDAIEQIKDPETRVIIEHYGKVEEDLEHLKQLVRSLKKKISTMTEPDYYLGMSDENAEYEDGKAFMAREILEELNYIV